MFVGNFHTLQAVNFLHLLHNIARQRFNTLQAQDIVRIYGTIDNTLAAVHHLAVMHQNLLLFRDQRFISHAVYISDHQALLAFGFLTERHRAGNLCQHAGIFRNTSFKQFGHARQTTGNIAGFRRGLRNTRQHIAFADFLAFAHGNHRAYRKCHRHGCVGAGNAHIKAVFIQQFHGRAQELAGAGGAAFAVDHHQSGQTGYFIGLLRHGYAFFDVFEAHRTGMLGNHRAGMRIPSGQGLAGFHRFAVLHQQDGAVRHFMALALTADVVVNHHFARAADHHQLAFVVGHITHLAAEACRAVGLGFHLAGGGGSRSRTTDVESTHGQLRARLTDGLRSNHADCLTGIHQLAARQVAAITMGAQAVAGFTGNRGAHFDFIHTGMVNQVDQLLVQQSAGFHQRFAAGRINHIRSGYTAENTVAQRFNHVTALHYGFHHKAVGGAAIVFHHHQILGNIYQTAGQVT